MIRVRREGRFATFALGPIEVWLYLGRPIGPLVRGAVLWVGEWSVWRVGL